jgi:F-box domain
MLPYACPAEIWLEVMAFLCTRDVIILSHTCKNLYNIADGVRQKRQHIQQFLSTFVDDVDGFRHLMQKTGAIIIGESAAAFFTGAVREDMYSLDVALYNMNLESSADSWFSFLKGETIGPPGKFPVCSSVDERVCSLLKI